MPHCHRFTYLVVSFFVLCQYCLPLFNSSWAQDIYEGIFVLAYKDVKWRSTSKDDRWIRHPPSPPSLKDTRTIKISLSVVAIEVFQNKLSNSCPNFNQFIRLVNLQQEVSTFPRSLWFCANSSTVRGTTKWIGSSYEINCLTFFGTLLLPRL